ncbi:s-adenosyl-l-methionine-dependent methyltransferase [Diplodia corticola]|uniref:S-adenosyl-l-methionine-dependent methyltransferase n=1 Tax=Diplodia corticola TaxID=236234 RepID=A0A1J9RV56_9PEZI|nr:s-adenosyl-l-methionine-dependent methyltransferase [Diplodia corticola]OJD36483.1 s-adenosyl-l-methionine-dependent methyltransferase [Diplodia corticola]
MPRIPHRLLRHARRADSLLPALLLACRDIASARNELRWLREHAEREAPASWRPLLRDMVRHRSAGRPLQYILGTEYFGDLEIACRPGVLIPRQETAASVAYLTERLSPALPKPLRVLDLCTGTGCIPLLFEDLLARTTPAPDVQLLGIDVSPRCVDLARHNARRCGSRRTDFALADVLSGGVASQSSVPPLMALLREKNMLNWDLLISNPPYISSHAFTHTTTRSVRNYEPKLALVPPTSTNKAMDSGDLFYPRLLEIADQVQAMVILFEVADMDQALRVARMAESTQSWHSIEIWKDEPAAKDLNSRHMVDDAHGFRALGCGNGRSVVCWRHEASQWSEAR